MAPKPDQMTAQLTGRLDGPHSDDDTAAVARLVAEAVRFLNYATRDSAGLTCPATACTVIGELACAVARLGQLAEQIGQFLARELAAGRLGDDEGSDPADVAGRADDFLATAAAAGTALAEALDAAQSYLARLHQAETGTAGERDRAAQAGVTA
jgi:hypothetical protein